MLNKLLIGAALTLALAACASTPSAPAANPAVAKTQPPPGCVGNAGSAIVRPSDSTSCAAFGSVYTKDDITHTGETTLGGALRILDPTLTVR